MDRITTGNERLDLILRGGLVKNSITLVAGAPGSGKTTLAEQCLFANATPDRPGVYLSTVSEPMDKLLRFGQTMSFFDAREIGKSVFYDELGTTLAEEGLPGTLRRIKALVKDYDPGVLVIDSFKALSVFAGSTGEYRMFLHELAGTLTARAMSTLWVGEYAVSEAMTIPEYAVADAVIDLSAKRFAERVTRYLTVHKLRGSDFAQGDHAYRLSELGILLFPRLADRLAQQPEVEAGEGNRVSSGIATLDDAIGRGYRPGSTTLVIGPSGSGKTIMGMHFIFAGLRNQHPGLLVSLQETKQQLCDMADSFGWSRGGNPAAHILECSPIDVVIDELAYDILERVETTGAKRVVIDSISDLVAASPDPMRFREFAFSLVRRLGRAGVSSMLTAESNDLFTIGRLDEQSMPHLADNVVLLQHIPRGDAMTRVLTVLKTRGAPHAPDIRELAITPNGLVLGERLTSTDEGPA